MCHCEDSGDVFEDGDPKKRDAFILCLLGAKAFIQSLDDSCLLTFMTETVPRNKIKVQSDVWCVFESEGMQIIKPGWNKLHKHKAQISIFKSHKSLTPYTSYGQKHIFSTVKLCIQQKLKENDSTACRSTI